MTTEKIILSVILCTVVQVHTYNYIMRLWDCKFSEYYFYHTELSQLDTTLQRTHYSSKAHSCSWHCLITVLYTCKHLYLCIFFNHITCKMGNWWKVIVTDFHEHWIEHTKCISVTKRLQLTPLNCILYWWSCYAICSLELLTF